MATVSAAGTTSGVSASLLGATAGTKSGAQAETDRFLKLLVAQLNNQDPLNPMDNAQMTSQMAQINTVSGIQQLNDNVKSLMGQFNAMQVLQGTSMVGREVLVSGNSLSVAGGVANGAFSLVGDADKVTLEILSPSGQLLETQQLGATKAGRNDFSWNNADYQGSAAIFKVTASKAGTAVKSDTYVRAQVEAVGSTDGNLSIQLKGRGSVSYDQITAFL
jgi:flagellar basal-body rod modification protein FlgD